MKQVETGLKKSFTGSNMYQEVVTGWDRLEQVETGWSRSEPDGTGWNRYCAKTRSNVISFSNLEQVNKLGHV
jgi:hypothetical protein